MLKPALQRLARGSIVYGVGSVLQRFIGLLLLPLFTRALAPADYGVVALVSLVTTALTGLFNLGTGNSMGVLYFREDSEPRREALIWTTATFLSVHGTVVLALLALGAPGLSRLMFHVPDHAGLIRLSMLGLLFTTLSEPFLAAVRMREQQKVYVALTFSVSLLTMLLSIWFVLVRRMGVQGVILAGTLGQAAMLLSCVSFVGRRLRFEMIRSFIVPLVRIGFPSIFGLFAFLLIDYADRQMIERMIGLDALGVYSVAYNFGLIMMIAVGAFASAWPPFFQSYVKKQEEACVVFGRVLLYYVTGFGALIVLFFWGAKPVVLWFTAPAFHAGYTVVGLVAAAYMLKGCYLIMLPGLYFGGRLKEQSYIEWVAAIINITLNLWMIPVFGLVGAATATLIGYLALPGLTWLVARRHLVVDYEWDRLSATVSTVFVTCLLLYWSSSQPALARVLTVNTVVLLVFVAIGYRKLLSQNERVVISRALSR